MNQIDTENVRNALIRCAGDKPHKVRVLDGEAVTREIPIPGGRKRWAAVIAVLEHCDWTSIEIVNREGGVLAIVPSTDGDDDPPTAPASLAAAADDGPGEAWVADLIFKAQAQAMSHREKEIQLILSGATAALRSMTEAVTGLAQIHQIQLSAQAQAYQVMAQAQAIRGDEGEPEDPGTLQSHKMIEQMLPILLPKILGAIMPQAAPPPPPRPAPPPAPAPAAGGAS